MTRINFTRKPSAWDQITSTTKAEVARIDGANWAAKLQVFDASEILKTANAGPLEDFRLCPANSLFILKRAGKAYLIDTQGSPYARYAIIIADFDAPAPDTPEALVERLAKQMLGFPTLEARNSDSLDFHEVYAPQLKKALLAAYRQGQLDGKMAAE